MGEIKDMNGTPINIGDEIKIGNDDHSMVAKINGFTNIENQILAQTNYGDFNITIVEKYYSHV